MPHDRGMQRTAPLDLYEPPGPDIGTSSIDSLLGTSVFKLIFREIPLPKIATVSRERVPNSNSEHVRNLPRSY